jgi:hypothetical protein
VRLIVEVVEGESVRPLVHQCRHSPDGFEWGYGGSGPADLAHSILADVLGRMPGPDLYQSFKSDFVANWSNAWSITEAEIQNWLLQPVERSDGGDDDAMGEL